MISDFYIKIPNDFLLTSSKARYYHSLIPQIEVLRKTEKIIFKTSINTPRNSNCVPLENDINRYHQYKPVYIKKNNHELVCYVPSEEVYQHTVKALKIILNDLRKVDIQFYKIDQETGLSSIISHWNIKDKVLFCRIQSYLDFLEILFYLEKTQDLNIIKDIFTKIELKRLDNLSPQEYKKEIELIKRRTLKTDALKGFSKEVKIENQPKNTKYLNSINIIYKDTEITLVQLPWGYSLSRGIMQELLKKNPSVRKVALVGGVGYIGNGHIDIDDIFIPDKLLNNVNEVLQFQNKATDYINTRKTFDNKRHVIGTLKTLVPNHTIFHYTDVESDLKNNVSAYDMELAGIIDGLKPLNKIDISATFYTMDKERENIHLGDTYYNKSFLNKLFKDFFRGKYNCFEMTTNFLLN